MTDAKNYLYFRENWHPETRSTLTSFQQYGFRLEISYESNFFLDAWRIQRVELEVHFGHYVERGFISGGHTQRYAELMRAPGYPKVIPFIHGALLNNANKKLS